MQRKAAGIFCEGLNMFFEYIRLYGTTLYLSVSLPCQNSGPRVRRRGRVDVPALPLTRCR